VFSLAIIFLPIFDKYKQWFIDTGKITHSFTIGNLQADPGWQGWEWITGVILLIGTIWAVTYLRRGKQQLGLIIQAAASTIFMFFTIVVITPKVEKFSQNSAIEFMKSMRGKDVYVETLYKSYAKFFYPQTRNLNEQHPFMQYWKLNGKNIILIRKRDIRIFISQSGLPPGPLINRFILS
jgi:hypothetical protein